MTSSCCSRFIEELCLPIFSLQDINGKAIDLQKTFAPTSNLIRFVKFLLVVFAISGVVIDISGDLHPYFWIAYFTHWGEILGTIYLILSFCLSIGCVPVARKYPIRNNKHLEATIWTKILWGLFSGIIVSEIIIIFMFWFTVYRGERIIYEMIFGHGLLFIAIAFDGHLLNSTPLRVKQIVYMYIIAVFYTIWSLIHGLATNIGNPNKLDRGESDDAIYSIINWTVRPISTIIVVSMLYVVAVPLAFAVFWGLSLAIPRRYLNEGAKDEKKDYVDVMTSLL